MASSASSETEINADSSVRAPLPETPPSLIALWLLRLLLFKLMFSSGCVKLASGDPNWRNLKALTFHYQTQPLPTWIGWYVSQLPLWFQKFSCVMMFGAELGAPFLIFAPRRLRLLGAAAIACLQILILLTGNYTFFNLLTLALCLLLLDDFTWARLIPGNLFPRRGAGMPGNVPARVEDATKNAKTVLCARNSRLRWPRFVTIPLAFVVVLLYLFQVSLTLGLRPAWFYPVAAADLWLSPFRTFNGYGLFAVMTTERREIVVEGSDDGVNWLPYEFKYKPGDVTRRPGFVAPFQPRLDWQMWFAALGDYRQNPWFLNFCVRLLQGSPEVSALLETNPFPKHPPQYVRAVFYDYQFTNFTERRTTRAWWKRFFDRMKRMPHMGDAGDYSSTMHYLKAIQAAGTDDAKAVMTKMREMPINDFFAKNGRIREDGRMVHEMYVYEVKKPEESQGEWDYYKLRAVIPGDDAFRSLKDSACPLVKKG